MQSSWLVHNERPLLILLSRMVHLSAVIVLCGCAQWWQQPDILEECQSDVALLRQKNSFLSSKLTEAHTQSSANSTSSEFLQVCQSERSQLQAQLTGNKQQLEGCDWSLAKCRAAVSIPPQEGESDKVKKENERLKEENERLREDNKRLNYKISHLDAEKQPPSIPCNGWIAIRQPAWDSGQHCQRITVHAQGVVTLDGIVVSEADRLESLSVGDKEVEVRPNGSFQKAILLTSRRDTVRMVGRYRGLSDPRLLEFEIRAASP